MGADQFIYDGASRLLSGSVMQGTFVQENSYDPFGNRTGVTTNGSSRPIPTDPATNRLMDQPEGAVAYDTAGNLLQWGPASWSYDALNMPVRQQGLTDRIYIYTADGERLATFHNDTQTSSWTVRDLNAKVLRVVSEAGGEWSWEKDYVYRDGSLLASESAAHGTWNYQLDHLGTIRVITAAVPGSDPIVGRHDDYAFGEPAVAPTGGEVLRFTGHERDTVTGPGVPEGFDLDYMHARYCSPVTGRFLGVDPIESGKVGVPQSWNKYAYALNNPLKYLDPDGRSVQAHTFLHHLNSFATSIDDFNRAAASIGAGFVPYIGETHDISMAVTGTDFITGQSLSTGERIGAGLGAGLPFVGGKVVSATIGKLNRIFFGTAKKGGNLAPETVIAAAREAGGEVVARKASGQPFDHITKYEQGRQGATKALDQLKRALADPSLSAADWAAVEQALSQYSKRLDELERLHEYYRAVPE